MSLRGVLSLVIASSAMLCAQTAPDVSKTPKQGWQPMEGQALVSEFVVEPQTRIPLILINSVSTKHSAEGDRVYLETAFPIMVRVGSSFLQAATSRARLPR